MSARRLALDFTGIFDAPPAKLSKPPKPPKPPKPSKPPNTAFDPWQRAQQYPLQVGGVCVCLMLLVVYGAMPRKQLRHIRHIPCRQKRGVYTCTVSKGLRGDVVVKMTDECAAHVFEVGGVPFTHARWHNMFRVRGASEVRVMDAFAGCTPRAYVDTRIAARTPTNDLVWCASNDHTSFTVTLDEERVLQDAGGALLQPKHNGVWTCYTYTLMQPVDDVQVTGDGRSDIHVYTRPEIVVSE